jgi:hypothetical protein
MALRQTVEVISDLRTCLVYDLLVQPVAAIFPHISYMHVLFAYQLKSVSLIDIRDFVLETTTLAAAMSWGEHGG